MITQMPTKPEELLLPILHRCYDVRVEGVIGAPILTLNLSLDPDEELVYGSGRIIQMTHPRFDQHYVLFGNYYKIANQVIITLQDVRKIEPPLLECVMVLSEDLKTGTAEYKYGPSDPRHVVHDAKVNSIPCPVESH